MDLLDLLQTYGGQGVFFVLFLYMFRRQEIKTDDRERKAEEREQKLLNELKSNQEILLQFSKKYDDITNDLDEIKEVVKKGE